MKRACIDIKKIIEMKLKLLTFTKCVTRRISQTKKTLKLSKDEPKKVSPGLKDDPSQDEQRPKKASMSSNGKNTATRARKKVKKTPQPKKAPKSPEL